MAGIGARIKDHRKHKGMKQKELHALAGISQKQMWMIEKGEVDPKWSTVVAIADALGVSLDDLAGRNGSTG